MTVPPNMTASEWILAEMARREAEAEAEWTRPLPTRGRRRVPGQSSSYSVRLDPEEVAALERRADFLGVKPSVLARRFIRAGLQEQSDERLSQAVERLESALEQVRGLIA